MEGMDGRGGMHTYGGFPFCFPEGFEGGVVGCGLEDSILDVVFVFGHNDGV